MARLPVIVSVLTILLVIVQPIVATVPGTNEPQIPEARATPAGPVVIFDEAHFPVYTVNPSNPSGYANGNSPQGAYADFAGVLANAGFTVRTLDFGGSLNSTTLSGVKVIVIVCSQGKDPNGFYAPVPYTGEEINALANFVRSGGGLFLIGDHTDFPPAIFPISEQFGIKFGQKLLRDPTDHVENATSGLPPEGDVFIVFGRDNFNDHPILENVTRVELYRTDILAGLPPEAQPLIISDADTYYIDGNGNGVSAPRSIVSAAIPSNGTAGAGRIVVVADTNTFETDENRDDGDADMDLFDSDNALYGTQMVRWLDVPRHLGVNIGSAEKASMGQKSISHDCPAGSNTTFYIKVSNAGNVADSYGLSVKEVSSAGWVPTMDTSSVTLNSADARIFTLIVSVPAGTQPGASARFRLEAVSRGDPSVSAAMNCTVQAPVVHNITITCADNRKSVQAGQAATYDLILSNRGNVRETVEISVFGPSGWTAALDAVLAEMEAASSRTLWLSVLSPADSLGGAEAKAVVSASLTGSPGQEASADTFTRVIQSFGIRLSCPTPVQAVDPGSLVSFPIIVSNTGNGDDQVALSIPGEKRWDAYIEPAETTLPFNSTIQAALVARAPEGAPAGERLELEVRAMSLREPTARANLSVSAVVNRMGIFILKLEPSRRTADPGTVALFNVTVSNIGNARETVMLETGGPAMLSQTEASVEPGAEASLVLRFPVAENEEAGALHFVAVTGTSSVNSTVWSTAGAVVVVNQLHKMRAALAPDRLVIAPGERGLGALSIANDGNGPEAVSVRIENAPAGWSFMFEDSVLAMDARTSHEQNLGIGIPVGTRAGSNGLAVNISYGNGGFIVVPFTVEVPRMFGFNCSVEPAGRSVLAGRQASYTIKIENLGNSPENITLSGAGQKASWVHPGEIFVLLNHSGGREVQLLVRPGPETMPGNYVLVLRASGEGNDSSEVSFGLTVKDAPTGTGDIPCLLGAALFLVASVAVYLARRRLGLDPEASDGPQRRSMVPEEAAEEAVSTSREGSEEAVGRVGRAG